jgi:hypothetical protein
MCKLQMPILISVCLACSIVRADVEVGDDIDPGYIRHEVVGSEIGPIDRTNVGITETVYLWVEGAEDWDDVDESEELDAIGDIAWTVSGNGNGTTYPVVAWAIYLYIEPAPSDGTITVEADVDDLFVFADDVAQAAQPKVLNRKVPTGVEAVTHYDVKPAIAGRVEHADGDLMRSAAVFLCEVTPKNVDFKGLPLRENIAEQTFFNWPDDGPNHTVPAKIKQISLATGASEFPPGTPRAIKNAFGDQLATDTINRSRLITAASCQNCHGAALPPGVSIDYEYDVRVPYEFKSGPGANDWTMIINSHHRKKFRGADAKSQVVLEASTTDQSSWMGPWKLP